MERPAEARVYLAVVDRAPHRPPLLRLSDEDEISGRGLVLIDACSAEWGYELLGDSSRPWGKRVWATLEIKS